MKKYIRMLILLICILLPSFQITAKAEDETLILEPCSLEKIGHSIYFSDVEKTGMIRSFDVSSEGRVATLMDSCTINVYEQYGFYDFTIYTNITRRDVIPHWDDDTLLIYVSNDKSYLVLKINGYDDYEVFECPADEHFEQYTYELITDKGRYYVDMGNLRYTDNESGEDYAITENTSFRPWWLLSIPILTAVIWFGGFGKKVKKWEEEQNQEFNN